MSPNRSERSVIVFLAAVGVMLAFGIDVALPAFDQIELDLPGASGHISLIGTSYFIGMAIGQVIYGPISDRFGRIPVLLFGLGLYGVAAVASSQAPTFSWLLAARLLWGLGAAAPAVLRSAIARDLYSGDAMARVITIMMAVFMIGPILVPFIGEGLLWLGSWRLVFGAGAILAALMATWTVRFGETLAEENQRPLSLGPLLEALRLVFRTRVTIGHILAQTLLTGAFLVYLGSGQPIIDKIYGRGDQFAIWFGVSGLAMIGALTASSRLITRFGARTMMVAVGSALFSVNLIGLVITLVNAGRPSFWIWLVWVAAANAANTMSTPLLNALALEPMGALAGTASAVLGAVSLAGGALIAAFIDSQINGTVTPMVLGYAVASGGALLLMLWARPTLIPDQRQP